MLPSSSPDNSASNNAKVIKSLQSLIDHFKEDPKCTQDPPRLSHYRDLPSEVENAYTLLDSGATMVHSTATKYTLVGKISRHDQITLGSDLLRGCELIGTSLHVILQDTTGCSRAVRQSTQRASLSIFVSVLQLLQAFEDESALTVNIGAQKTGAVWEACDQILKQLLPKGNRNAIRRELFTWTRETNDTMEEFQQMIDMGPREGPDDGEDDNDEDDDDNFFDNDDQYTDEEMPVAKACLGVLQNSRGNLKIALETCEVLGDKNRETQNDTYLESIQKIHKYAKCFGEGVTDLGSLMYPPFSNTSQLDSRVKKQVEHTKMLQDFILGLEGMPVNVTELSNILSNASVSRKRDFDLAVIAFESKK